MSNPNFKYDLGQRVSLRESGGAETGEVIGRAQYSHAEDGYLIRYRAGDGRCVETWWGEAAIAA